MTHRAQARIFSFPGTTTMVIPRRWLRAFAFEARFLFAIGDRDLSALWGCVGAPAISQERVFGIVSQCSANRSPVISFLSMARGFIERNVPRPITDPRPIS